jgi:hypothetical protein
MTRNWSNRFAFFEFEAHRQSAGKSLGFSFNLCFERFPFCDASLNIGLGRFGWAWIEFGRPKEKHDPGSGLYRCANLDDGQGYDCALLQGHDGECVPVKE